MGRYTVKDKVGSGGMGAVYRAIQEDLGREVALKFLPPHAAANPELLKRFQREFRLISQLVHPNIVRVYDFGELDGLLFYAMELVTGNDLSKLGALDFPRVRQILEETADALAYLHEHQLWHRDVKPKNLMLTAEGRLLLVDFGLAKDPETTAVTVKGELVGTARYLAPEVLAGHSAEAAADVYDLGLVAHELLTGKPAFHAETMARLLVKIARGDRQPLNVERLPGWFTELLAQTLALDPKARPSAALIRDTLRRHAPEGSRVVGEASQVAAPEPREAPREPARAVTPRAVHRTPHRPARPAPAAMAAGIAVLLSAGAVFLRSPAPVPAPSPVTSATPSARASVAASAADLDGWSQELSNVNLAIEEVFSDLVQARIGHTRDMAFGLDAEQVIRDSRRLAERFEEQARWLRDLRRKLEAGLAGGAAIRTLALRARAEASEVVLWHQIQVTGSYIERAEAYARERPGVVEAFRGLKQRRRYAPGTGERLQRYARALGDMLAAVARDPAGFDAHVAEALAGMWRVFSIVHESREGYAPEDRVATSHELLATGFAGISGPLANDLKQLAWQIQEAAEAGSRNTSLSGGFKRIRDLAASLRAAAPAAAQGLTRLLTAVQAWESGPSTPPKVSK